MSHMEMKNDFSALWLKNCLSATYNVLRTELLHNLVNFNKNNNSDYNTRNTSSK